MKKNLLYIAIGLSFFACKENTKVTTTKFTDTGIKDTMIVATPVKTDTLKADSIKTKPIENDTIVPGVSVGNISLGEKTETLIQKKGIPDSSDAAMSKAYNGWFKKPGMIGADTVLTSFETFSIVSGKNEKETASRIKRIRITSSLYKTAMQIKTGNTLAYIKLQYPSLKKPVATTDLTNGNELEVYDEKEEGIAFEIVNNKCVAIIIHEKGQKYSSVIF